MMAARPLFPSTSGGDFVASKGISHACRYSAVPIELGGTAKKRVDVERFYDVARYRPNIANVMGMPMFLH